MPALADAHVHLGLIDPAALLAGGISAVDDLGGVPSQLAALRTKPGLPRIAFAGAFLPVPGGYPRERRGAPRGSWRETRAAGDAADAAGEQVQAGASLLKVALNPLAGPIPSRPQLTAIVAIGLPVVAHAEGPGMTELALDAGVARLAHTPWTHPLDPGVIRAAASRMVWISTLAIHSGRARVTALSNLRRFLDAGGRVRYGTDMGNNSRGPQPVGVNPAEIRALQEAGMSVDDVLGAMTQPPHQPDGQPDLVPCLVPGGLDRDPRRFAGSLATAAAGKRA